MSFPTYPFTTFDQAITGSRFASDQFHRIVNGSSIETINAVDGPIPSVRKVLQDITNLGTARFKFDERNANFTAEVFRTHVVDTTAVPIAVTLPANAEQGQYVYLIDKSGTANSNNITVLPSDSDTINGADSYTKNQIRSVTLFYKTSGTSWMVYTIAYESDDSGEFQINDNSVHTLPIPARFTYGSVKINASDLNIASEIYFGLTGNPQELYDVGNNVKISLVDLTGTKGEVGDFSIFLDRANNQFKFENRVGSQLSVKYNLF